MIERDETADVPETDHRFLLPIPDLKIEDTWQVGSVTLLPSGAVAELIARQRASDTKPAHPYDAILDNEEGSRLNGVTVAQVEATTPRLAYDAVSDALAILRLFQHSRFPTADTDWQTFGLPGQVRSWAVEFIDLDAGPAAGWFSDGAAAGWTFSASDREAFNLEFGMQYLCGALSNANRTPFEQRALIATRLFSASSLAYDADHKLLAAVAALEVLLGDGGRVAQQYAVARRGAFLYCIVGTDPPSMCGRDRAACPYIALDPCKQRDRRQIDALLARAHGPGMYCSQYAGVRRAYELRHRSIHQGTASTTVREVRDQFYLLYRWLIPEILRWYASHPANPISDLDDEISRVIVARPPNPVPALLSDSS